MIKLVPALHKMSSKWSAFIDPTMGSMFIDEPGLEMAPNLDRQADMLGGLKSIKTVDFERVLAFFAATSERDAELAEQAVLSREVAVAPMSDTVGARTLLSLGGGYQNPRCFLLAVMNDASVSAQNRIDAAKALLPYFDENCSEGGSKLEPPPLA